MNADTARGLAAILDAEPGLARCTPDVEVLSRDENVVLRYRFQLEEETRAFVVKIQPHRVARTAAILRTLYCVLRERDAGTLAAPELVPTPEDSRVLIVRECSGTPLDTALEQAGQEGLCRRIGVALSELHALPAERFESDLRTTLRDHVRELIRPHPHELARAFPEHEALIERTLTELDAASRAYARIHPVPIHRDFHQRQLLATETHLTLLDWDTFALGDPAFDVAYFTAYQSNHLPRQRAHTYSHAFLTGYLQRGDTRVQERLETYERFNYLRRACRRFRRRDEGWERELHRMLGKLERTQT